MLDHTIEKGHAGKRVLFCDPAGTRTPGMQLGISGEIYIFAERIYIMDTVISRRKLIDLKGSVFESLTLQARQQGVSLKRYIETVLEENAQQYRSDLSEHASDPRILSLVGIAKRSMKDVDPSDDRAQYILSK